MADDVKYDYAPSLDEIVFEKRNKEYGAYDLRHKYPWILTKAFLVGTIIFLLLAITPFVVMKIKEMNAPPPVKVKADMMEILDDKPIIEPDKPEPEPPKEVIPPPKIEIIQNIVPEPAKAPIKQTPPPKISDQAKTTTGPEPQAGTPTPNAPPAVVPTAGTGAGTFKQKPLVDPKKIYDDVEQLAEFPGGLDAFRTKVSNSFDQGEMDGEEGTMRTEITFIVETNGTITDVKSKGPNKYFNAEAERTVKSISTKWVPAKVNGESVRYRYRLPIAMQF